MVAGLFIPNPFFGTNLAPVGHRTQNDLLADRHGKVIDMPAGEIIALVTSIQTPGLDAGADFALLAVHETVFGKTSVTGDIRDRQLFGSGQDPLAGGPAAVELQKLLLQLPVPVAAGQVNSANPAIETTGGNKIQVKCHLVPYRLFSCLQNKKMF
jgi:hypothetical protein